MPQYFQNVILKFLADYGKFLSYKGLEHLQKPAWQNNTKRNLTAWHDSEEF